jgi:Zn-finger nucleic acid-binding protein
MFGALKGWFGEKLTTFGMWSRLDANIYRRIDDIILPSKNSTTQIDHVLVSVFGVFVIETKNMRGWIFGGEKDSTWCQSIYGHKTRFQNPLRQNYRHIECLADFLRVDRPLFHSVVFFVGECEFRTPVPSNVLCSGLSSYIMTFNDSLLSQSQVEQIEWKLREVKTTSGLTKSDHLASLNRRHASTDVCPRCGGKMVARTARNCGKQFLGCANFPKCRHTIWPKEAS